MLLLHAFSSETRKVGRKLDSRPLIYSSMNNALIYTLLVLGFHVVEEAIKRLIHGAPILSLPGEIHFDELLARSIVVFCVFIPFFTFMELRRVLGENRFHDLFVRSAEAGRLDESS